MSDDNGTSWALPLHERGTLEVQVDLASLAFLPVDPGDQPRVHSAAPEHEAPRVHVDKVAGVTRVTIGWEALRWGFWRDRRRYHLMFRIPHGLRVRVEASAGRVAVARLSFADLDVSADTGEVRLDDVEGHMKLSTDTGRIAALDVAGTFDVRTDTGTVRVRARRIDPGTSSASTDMGAIRVELPQGVPVVVAAHTGLGAVRVDVPRVTTAPATLIARSDMGLIEVTEHVPRRSSAQEGPADGPYRTRSSPSAEAPPDRVPDDAPAPIDPIDRVVRLMVEGRITASEAAELLAALDP